MLFKWELIWITPYHFRRVGNSNPYMCLQTRVFKNENTTKKYQKMVAQDLSIYGMMFRKRSHVSTKFTQMTYVKSSDLIKPPRNSSKNTSNSSKFHPPCAWRSKKCKSLSFLNQPQPKPWSAAARSAVKEEPLTLRPRLPFLPPKRYIPSAASLHTDVCPLRSAGAVPLGDS